MLNQVCSIALHNLRRFNLILHWLISKPILSETNQRAKRLQLAAAPLPLHAAVAVVLAEQFIVAIMLQHVQVTCRSDMYIVKVTNSPPR